MSRDEQQRADNNNQMAKEMFYENAPTAADPTSVKGWLEADAGGAVFICQVLTPNKDRYMLVFALTKERDCVLTGRGMMKRADGGYQIQLWRELNRTAIFHKHLMSAFKALCGNGTIRVCDTNNPPMSLATEARLKAVLADIAKNPESFARRF